MNFNYISWPFDYIFYNMYHAPFPSFMHHSLHLYDVDYGNTGKVRGLQIHLIVLVKYNKDF